VEAFSCATARPRHILAPPPDMTLVCWVAALGVLSRSTQSHAILSASLTRAPRGIDKSGTIVVAATFYEFAFSAEVGEGEDDGDGDEDEAYREGVRGREGEKATTARMTP